MPLTRLEQVSSLSLSKEHAKELLSQAMTLLPSDWSDTIRKLKGRPTREDGHSHVLDHYEICKICGQKKKTGLERSEI